MIMPQFFGVCMNKFKCIAEKIIENNCYLKCYDIKDVYNALAFALKGGMNVMLYEKFCYWKLKTLVRISLYP